MLLIQDTQPRSTIHLSNNKNLPLIQLFNKLLEINEKTISKMEDILKFERLSRDCFRH